MDIKSVWLYVLVLSSHFVCGRKSDSPCPGIFDFETDGDGTYGIITVTKDDEQEPVSILETKLNFTVVNRMNNDRGRIETLSSHSVRMYNQGQAVRYRVRFPVIIPLPKVTSLEVNGDIICFGPGDTSKPGKRVSRINLRMRSTSGSPLKPVDSRPMYGYAVTKPVDSRPIYGYAVTKPVDSRPMYGMYAVTKPTQNDNTLAPRPEVSVRPENRFPSFLATSETVECGVVAGGNEWVPLVNNGHFYERGEIPWLVAIYRIIEDTLRFICGGTLVSDRHVVTAAHCMRRPTTETPMAQIVVKLGVHRLNSWSDELIITRQLMAATIHEDYNPNPLQNDILILTLDKRVKFNNYIRPACLWSGDTELARVVGATGVVAGWGDRSAEDKRGKLDEPQMVRVPIVSTKDCKASKPLFHTLTFNTTLCAGDRKGAGPCTGDSGGGLYLIEGGKWRLRGIVSISLLNEARTCDLSEYVVFTDTAQFLPWIRNILSKNNFD